MKNKYNTIQKYILDNSVKNYTKETVNGLFRAILEPVISNQKFEAMLLFRIKEIQSTKTFIQRLCFSNVKMYSFNENLKEFGLNSTEEEDIWGESEFLIVLGQRYSAALIWDFSLGENNTTPVCIIYNSKKINEIAKCINDNSKEDFKELINKYVADRRENSILNRSIQNICNMLDDKETELLFSIAQNTVTTDNSETFKTAEIVAEKAKFIAHEIKNNLSIVNLYSKITEKRLQNVSLKEEEKTSIDTALKNIEKASQSISYLINDLRCLSAPYLSKTNIRDVIINTLGMCSLKAEKANVEIELNNLVDKTFNLDKSKIECAVMNVIFNAIEACSENCKITIDTTEQDDYISILISNNGEKIEKENIEKIFQTDFTTKERGNGIGLSTCKSQLKLTGCDLNLVKSDEKETVFEILVKIQ